MCLVDQKWEHKFNTQKMRGLKQIFISLFLFGNNKFIDGKKVEYAHLFGKKWQLKHNNFRLPFKETVSKHAARMLSLIYIFNGGKWGDELQYKVGDGLLNMRDPDNPHKPHPALQEVLIPQPSSVSPKIEIKRMYNSKHIGTNDFVSIFHDNLKMQLNTLLSMKFPNVLSNIDHIGDSNLWSIRQIASFTFHGGYSSFHMNFDRKINDNQNTCVVKLMQGYIMKFDKAFVIQHEDYGCAYLCKGTYWNINKSNNSQQWINDYYSSMNFINIHNSRIGWCFMSNIAEPVFLIHNCVNFQQVKQYLPAQFADINNFDYVQNISHWSNAIHRWKNNHRAKQSHVPTPCGPMYFCRQHNNNACSNCVHEFNVYPEQHWYAVWKCNTQMSPHFYILDAENGLVMTMMKTCAKYAD